LSQAFFFKDAQAAEHTALNCWNSKPAWHLNALITGVELSASFLQEDTINAYPQIPKKALEKPYDAFLWHQEQSNGNKFWDML
jgi:hypothetical protein